MGGIGHNYFGALHVAVGHMILAHHHQTGQLTMSAGIWIERKLIETGDIGEIFLQIVVKLKCPLHTFGTLQRVDPGECGHCRKFLVDLRIIFHRARAKRIESRVDTKILGGKIRIMPHDIKLAHFGEFGFVLALQSGGKLGKGIVCVFVGRKFITLSAGTR